MLPCSKAIAHGHFMEPCSAVSGSKCMYACDTGYVQQPIVQHVICHNGQWTIDSSFLCKEQSGTVAYSQKQDEGTSSGAVAGIVIAAILLTIVIVLGIAYFVWWRKKPQETYNYNNTI